MNISADERNDGRSTRLVSPLVDDRHVEVVHEGGHLLTGRRTVRRSDTFVHVAFNGSLCQSKHPYKIK